MILLYRCILVINDHWRTPDARLAPPMSAIFLHLWIKNYIWFAEKILSFANFKMTHFLFQTDPFLNRYKFWGELHQARSLCSKLYFNTSPWTLASASKSILGDHNMLCTSVATCFSSTWRKEHGTGILAIFCVQYISVCMSRGYRRLTTVECQSVASYKGTELLAHRWSMVTVSLYMRLPKHFNWELDSFLKLGFGTHTHKKKGNWD